MTTFVGVLTVSDSAARGEAEDISGPLLAALVQAVWPEQTPVAGDVRGRAGRHRRPVTGVGG